jgi:signal transduction histidine kinase/DNA-binding response OmpR family regulator/HPt (histidine-containing phosphotransfer) domain-containing protein
MGLRLKNGITVTCVFIAIIVATYLLFTRIILREFDSIERERTKLNIARVFQSLDAVKDDLRSRTIDWARWDETFDYIRGKNRSYIETNVNYEAVAPFELVHIIFLSKERESLFAEEVSVEEKSLQPIPNEILSRLTKNPAVAEYLLNPHEDSFSGLIMNGEEPLFIAISPISDNQGKAPHNGFLVFTRAFSATLEDQIRKRTQLQLTFTSISRDQPLSTTTKVERPYTAEIRTDDRYIEAIGTVNDSAGQPIIAISHRAPRSIYQQGKASRDYMVSLIAICLVLANIVLIGFLNRTVIGRLERFAARIGMIASTKDFSLRVREEEGDEIGSLISTFNGLIKTTEETTTQLARARDKALRATQAKSSFVAHVSHELRTPIHSLSGLLRILFKGESSPTKRAYIQMAQDSAATLLATINNILDLSKVESGAIEIQNTPFSLRQVLRAAVRGVSPRVDDKPFLSFLLDIEPGIPDNVVGDPLRLQQILVNLLANATKFTHQGTISLRVSPQKIDEHRAHVIFQITDTGIGMTDEQVSRVFKPYLQADETIQTTYEGTGLGLSIVTTLTEQLGGSVGVSSILHRGTTFTVILPLEIDGTAVAPPTLHNHMSCVLIDEFSSSASWILEGLARYTCSTEILSPTDESALNRLANGGYTPDFVLISPKASETPLLLEYLRKLRAALSCPIITSLKASDMVAHERMQAFGEITLIEAPTAPEELVRLARDTTVPQTPPEEQNSLSSRKGASPCRILVADDTPTSRLIIREMLEEAGYEVETVENGHELVERVRCELQQRSDCPITAILTDIEMPIMGGVEATEAIRELERESCDAKRFPIIAITAHALLEEQERFRNGGIDYVVTKPLRPADLDAALSHLLTAEPEGPARPVIPPAPPISVESALRDLTHRLWNEVGFQGAKSTTPTPDNGIDIDDVFERSGDSPRRTKLMLNAFLGSYHEPLSKLQDLSDPTALKELTRAAHSLKGMLLDVGAKHAASLAGSIERSLQAGDTTEATLQCETFQRETTLIANLIERVVRHFPSRETT